MFPRLVRLTLLMSVVALHLAPPVSANDPTSGPAVDQQVSVHAEMLAANPGDPGAFTAGSPPVPLVEPTGTGTVAGQGASAALPNGLFREVFGYLPYWMLGSSSMPYLDYGLLSTIAYFSVGAQSNGSLLKTDAMGDPTVGWAGWTSAAMTDVIDAAHRRGVKVVLTVTMMAWGNNYDAMTALLTSSTNRARLAGEIASAVKTRNADGVNLDFEPVPASLESQYTQFVREVKARLVSSGAGSHLTVATMAGAAASWSTHGYDVVGLTAPGAADALMVMAYDFHWSGSSRAGGVAPVSSSYVYDVSDALRDHLAVVPGSKLIWGVPYYGREWSTSSDARNATTTSTLKSAAGHYTLHRGKAATHGRKWHDVERVPWYVYRDSTHDTWVQGYYDDAASLTAKYDLVNTRDLRGVGVWHLLMDGARPELWHTLQTNFRGAWFEDVLTSAFRADILAIANAGITSGCGFERFCPKSTVTREQMASFLARALRLPAATRDYFSDDASSPHQADINRLAEAGITGGCGTGRFCPTRTVTREQMASFLARALDPPATTTDYFADDAASAHQADINRLAAAGVTGGCATGRFCPTASILREQMAAFLNRAFLR
jgi:spore germination protein YaaH